MAIKTIVDIKTNKNKPAPLVCLTAYTTSMAASIAPHTDFILVGDSLGMVLYGMDSTRGVSLEMMINHGQAVRRGAAKALIIVDMPFGTYEDSPTQALENAKHLIDATKCTGVKLEGGADIAPTIAHLIENDIPVMGHIGLMPQAVEDGKFLIKGKTKTQAEQLLSDARAVEDAGAFAIVIEGTIEPVAAQITSEITIPTIGIGASAACDGQVLVTEDMLGLLHAHTPKFVKQYAHLKTDIDTAIKNYAQDVRARIFPGTDQLYTAAKKSENK